MQNWKDLYLEHADILSQKSETTSWIDLWHNQVNFLDDEHPFPTPAAFLSYRTRQVEDTAERVQKVVLQVDVYLFYETFADTYKDAFNQESALSFIDWMDEINAIFHGADGTNFSNMRRLGFAPIDTGNAGNLYRISYECTLLDYSAKKGYENTTGKDICIIPSEDPYQID